MVEVEFLEKCGSYKKGDKTEMFKSTAEALEEKKIVKITSKKEEKKE